MLRIILLFTILSTSIFAQDDEEFSFMGLTASYNVFELIQADDKKQTTIGIRYGKQTIEWRTMFSYQGNNDLQTFELEVDKLIEDDIFNIPELRLYLGGTFGGIEYKGISNKESQGKYYGGNIGFLIYVTDKIDADIGYHYYSTSSFDVINKIKGLTLSLHYFY